jgi:hypothetical protein
VSPYAAFAILCAALALTAAAWSLYDYRRDALRWRRLKACCHGNELAVLEAAEAMRDTQQHGYPLTIEETARLAATVH